MKNFYVNFLQHRKISSLITHFSTFSAIVFPSALGMSRPNDVSRNQMKNWQDDNTRTWQVQFREIPIAVSSPICSTWWKFEDSQTNIIESDWICIFFFINSTTPSSIFIIQEHTTHSKLTSSRISQSHVECQIHLCRIVCSATRHSRWYTYREWRHSSVESTDWTRNSTISSPASICQLWRKNKILRQWKSFFLLKFFLAASLSSRKGGKRKLFNFTISSPHSRSLLPTR